jgi:hypothetical protein
MTFTHELGHVVGGVASGGTLVDADLAPWSLPYSLFNPNPRPLVTLWSGPLMGVLVPLAVAAMVQRDAAWFVAYFCLLANGVYLAIGWVSGDRLLDTAQLLKHGAWPIAIATYCLVTVAVGYTGFRRACVQALSAAMKRPDNVSD